MCENTVVELVIIEMIQPNVFYNVYLYYVLKLHNTNVTNFFRFLLLKTHSLNYKLILPIGNRSSNKITILALIFVCI